MTQVGDIGGDAGIEVGAEQTVAASSVYEIAESWRAEDFLRT